MFIIFSRLQNASCPDNESNLVLVKVKSLMPLRPVISHCRPRPAYQQHPCNIWFSIRRFGSGRTNSCHFDSLLNRICKI